MNEKWNMLNSSFAVTRFLHTEVILPMEVNLHVITTTSKNGTVFMVTNTIGGFSTETYTVAHKQQERARIIGKSWLDLSPKKWIRG